MKKKIVAILFILFFMKISFSHSYASDHFSLNMIEKSITQKKFRTLCGLFRYSYLMALKGIDSANSYYRKEHIKVVGNYTDYLPLTAGSGFPLTGVLVGTDAFFSGNIGIGSSSQYYKLAINTSGMFGLRMGTVNSTVGGPIVDFYDNGRNVETVISSTDGTMNGSYFASYSNTPLLFGTNAGSSPTAKMTILSGGNVGIGTSNPTYKLAVHTTGVAGFNVNTINSTVGGPIVDFYDNGRNVETVISSTDGTTNGSYLASFSNTPLLFGANAGLAPTAKMIILPNGNVGVGNASPGSLLSIGSNSIRGTMVVQGITPALTIADLNTGGHSYTLYGGVSGQGSFDIFDQSAATTAERFKFSITASGNVGIGMSYGNINEKLTVNGNIKAKKILVSHTGWPDFVFHPSYNLMPLSELEKFVKQNRHLPELPSAKNVEKNGISVGDNQALLLKKIEELTLYIIEMKKEIIELKRKTK